MYLSPSVKEKYTEDKLDARKAQRIAEYIAFAPMVFQVSRLMVKWGILELLRSNDDGLTEEEIAEKTGLSLYAIKILLEASLSIGTVLVNEQTDKFTISKIGWFLINDPATRVNMDFNHDVNYKGLFYLDEALKEGRPAGLKHFGPWRTIYEGLSKLEPQVQKSWFNFDHFYSDSSFHEALEIVFANHPRHILDVGGNTGRWAMRCVDYDPLVSVTIVDLPGQLKMMREQTEGKPGADRIDCYEMDLLDSSNAFPNDKQYDAIWMSQFLDCFNISGIESILSRAAAIMNKNTTLYIMETLWNRQKFEPASLCLTLTSVYFTALANGNSKMYHSDDLIKAIENSGLSVVTIHDYLGQGHSILECKIK